MGQPKKSHHYVFGVVVVLAVLVLVATVSIYSLATYQGGCPAGFCLGTMPPGDVRAVDVHDASSRNGRRGALERFSDNLAGTVSDADLCRATGSGSKRNGKSCSTIEKPYGRGHGGADTSRTRVQGLAVLLRGNWVCREELAGLLAREKAVDAREQLIERRTSPYKEIVRIRRHTLAGLALCAAAAAAAAAENTHSHRAPASVGF